MSIDKGKKPGKKRAEPKFSFEAELWKSSYGGAERYAVMIPEEVSMAIGKRGPVPIFATVNRAEKVQASLVPMGGGRHRLGLNARVREALRISPGDRVRVEIVVPKRVPKPKVPGDLAEGLKEFGLLEEFKASPVGKQNHIIGWVVRAAHVETQQKRIAQLIEIMLRAREKREKRPNRGAPSP